MVSYSDIFPINGWYSVPSVDIRKQYWMECYETLKKNGVLTMQDVYEIMGISNSNPYRAKQIGWRSMGLIYVNVRKKGRGRIHFPNWEKL